uniref:Mediator of RNA polymerase II transcription subunit 28 n=2 Tax=Timema TaxID=61471 RepID=A0A7R9FHI7_9NEOP|nr:unnamed protein product [Timema bartmani]CAD7452536.1 unnamed protein product [Timema tahoe]
MATTANGNGNLVDEFEEAFQSCLNVLTKEEALSTMEKDEIRVEVDHTILRFIDLARQMEAFFLQKRFLLSALKPELVVKEGPGMPVASGSGGPPGPMVTPQQAMFLQQQAAGGPRGPPFSTQGPGGVLQGPLAYLEKTTSNIGLPEGRREESVTRVAGKLPLDWQVPREEGPGEPLSDVVCPGARGAGDLRSHHRIAHTQAELGR